MHFIHYRLAKYFKTLVSPFEFYRIIWPIPSDVSSCNTIMPVKWKVYRSWVNTNNLKSVTIKPVYSLNSKHYSLSLLSKLKLNHLHNLAFRFPQIHKLVAPPWPLPAQKNSDSTCVFADVCVKKILNPSGISVSLALVESGWMWLLDISAEVCFLHPLSLCFSGVGCCTAAASGFWGKNIWNYDSPSLSATSSIRSLT